MKSGSFASALQICFKLGATSADKRKKKGTSSMTSRLIALTVLCLALALAWAAPAKAESGDSGVKSDKPSCPAPQLLTGQDLNELSALEADRPLTGEVIGGQWAETDVWAWGLCIGVGVAICLALTLS
jgi:hypothetical protein